MFKDRNTMVSLEIIQVQDAEYVKNVIGKLPDSRPNIVLIEKTKIVAKTCQADPGGDNKIIGLHDGPAKAWVLWRVHLPGIGKLFW